MTERERDRQTEHERGRGRERETQNLKEAPGSELSATEPDTGLEPMSVRPRPESKLDAQPTEPPRCPQKITNKKILKKNVQVNSKHMETFSTLLTIREMQMKTTMRYHFIPTRMATVNVDETSIGEDAETLEPSHTDGRNAKWCSTGENTWVDP